jgi:protoporphyrinogen/coproporphyrinogen III oxidase
VTRKVAVVGAGVSGLTTAFRLSQQDPSLEVTVFEAESEPGGKLTSVQVGDLTLPAGADSFLARRPWAVDLCKELGLGAQLVSPDAGTSLLWTDHGLEPFLRDAPFGIPGDVADVFRWPGLSRGGRTRAAKDLLIRPHKGDADESIGSLLRRRLGDQATELSVAPLLEGLFAGDADRLSVRATFPELADWEKSQGSLIRGSQAASRNARKGIPTPMFLRPRAGVQRLTEVLAGRLGSAVRCGVPVSEVGSNGSTFVVGSEDFDAVVLATPASVSSQLLSDQADFSADLAADLASIPYASTGVVLMVFAEGTANELPPSSGFVVPRGKAPMTACTFLSNKWPDPSFGRRAVVRCYVGGVGAEDILEADDSELVEACARHLAALVKLPEAPEHSAVIRWPKAMPQYEVGHLDLVSQIRKGLPPGLFVTGQAYDGVGIPDCVRAAGEAAQAVSGYLNYGDALGAASTDKETVA